MSMNKKEGGQAFPTGNPEHGGFEGMTLRDWFAGQVLGHVLAEEMRKRATQDRQGIPFKTMAASAYRIADAMLAERSKS